MKFLFGVENEFSVIAVIDVNVHVKTTVIVIRQQHLYKKRNKLRSEIKNNRFNRKIFLDDDHADDERSSINTEDLTAKENRRVENLKNKRRKISSRMEK